MFVPSRLLLTGLWLAACYGGSDPTTAVGQVNPRAIMGQPFGVGSFSLRLPDDVDPQRVDSAAFSLQCAEGRVFYPAISAGRFGEVAAQVLGDGVPPLPQRLNVSFLFTGQQPLRLTVFTPAPHEFVLTPEAPRRPQVHHRALTKWWKAYNAVARQQQRQGDYPPLVETYLTSMLGQRLNLRPPLLTRMAEPERSDLQQTFGRLVGTESLRSAVLKETMRGAGVGEVARIAVPPEVVWQPLALQPNEAAVNVEPIALHVPEECFYVRFGSFANYLWVDHLKDDYGGDLRQMVTLRGHNARLDEKMQQQLALKQTALAEIMGPKVIADVALIGRDLYLREGAAIGMLFQASNTAIVGANFSSDRQAILKEWQPKGATLETVKIADHDVSFLLTPDNRLRSFHAVDGDFHLVTTCRSMVERFYAAGRGEGSLGSSVEFQQARLEMPLSRELTVFAYFSSAFFRGLLSPQYQIELSRRLRSVVEMELIQLAQLAAVAEGRDHETLDDLIAGDFLPSGFGQRGDGGPPLATDHGFFDEQRGARGTFTPIPDMPLTAITAAEAEQFNRCVRFLQTQWQQMDPLMVGVRRFALAQDRHERIVIDATVPVQMEEKYGWLLSMVGPPTDVTIRSDPTDVITLQMSLKGGLLWPAIPAHHLFLGVQDVDPGVDVIPEGFLKTLFILKTTPGYLGSWPKLGLLDILPFLNLPPDILGFSPLPLGLWRWQGGGFSVLSFHRPVLEEAAVHLRPVPTDNPAQIRVRIGDLTTSKLARWVTLINYSRSEQASRGNVRLLETLSEQLRVSPPQSLELANQLLDTQLVCALGGDYEFVEAANGRGKWRSTSWSDRPGRLPVDYTAPLLDWFRGASVDLTKQGERMSLHAEIDMLRKERAPAIKLPLFDLFGGKKSDED